MLYAIKLGPVPMVESGGAYAYVGFTDEGMVPPVFSHREPEALRKLAEQGQGQELRCEPALAQAGRPAGFRSGPMPEKILPMRASLAILLGLGKVLDGVRDPHLVWALAQAASEFWAAKPFLHWHDEQPLEITVEGALAHTFEASILGNAGQEFGLALYFQPGGIRKVVRSFSKGRLDAAASVEALSMTLNDEPAFTIAALTEAIGLDRVPVPMRIGGGKPRSVTEPELAALAAAVRAVAKLTPAQREATGEVEVGEVRATARVKAPSPKG